MAEQNYYDRSMNHVRKNSKEILEQVKNGEYDLSKNDSLAIIMERINAAIHIERDKEQREALQGNPNYKKDVTEIRLGALTTLLNENEFDIDNPSNPNRKTIDNIMRNAFENHPEGAIRAMIEIKQQREDFLFDDITFMKDAMQCGNPTVCKQLYENASDYVKSHPAFLKQAMEYDLVSSEDLMKLAISRKSEGKENIYYGILAKKEGLTIHEAIAKTAEELETIAEKTNKEKNSIVNQFEAIYTQTTDGPTMSDD